MESIIIYIPLPAILSSRTQANIKEKNPTKSPIAAAIKANARGNSPPAGQIAMFIVLFSSGNLEIKLKLMSALIRHSE